MIFKLIDKYRREAWESHNTRLANEPTWREAILETIFRPRMVHPGKGPMTHLHPKIKELHLPDHMYIADWRKYRIEDHPILVKFQERCHAAGMHDPWLRNYCFQFYDNQVMARSRTRAVTTGCLTGFVLGFGLHVIMRASERYTNIWGNHHDHDTDSGSDDGHHHDQPTHKQPDNEQQQHHHHQELAASS